MTYLFIAIAFTIGFIVALFIAKKRYYRIIDITNKNAQNLELMYLDRETKTEQENNIAREKLVQEYEKLTRDLKSQITKYKTPRCSCGRFKKKGKIKCKRCEKLILDNSNKTKAS